MILDYIQFGTGLHFSVGSLGHFISAYLWIGILFVLWCVTYVNNHHFKVGLVSCREQLVVGLYRKLLLQGIISKQCLDDISYKLDNAKKREVQHSNAGGWEIKS